MVQNKEPKSRRLTYGDRLKIEMLLNDLEEVPEVAEKLGVTLSTIYRELSKGGAKKKIIFVGYDADRAQKGLKG